MALIKQKLDQKGAVALITAMIVSILLMITTAGMVALTTKSLRQSTDGAQSTKAYYAAEGGLEEALLRIRNGDISNNCPGGSTSPASAKDGVVTCAIVGVKDNVLVGHVDADKTNQLDLSNVSGLNRIVFEWSQGGTLARIPDYNGSQGWRARNDFPLPANQIRKWYSDAPAVVEFAVIEYPKTADDKFTLNDVDFYNSILAPKSNNPSDASGMIPARDLAIVNYAESSKDNTANAAYVIKCVPTGEYQCTVAFGTFKPSSRYVLRIKSRYNATNYRVTALGAGSDTPLTIPGAMITVDVTARAGDVFRRIQTSFPQNGNPIPTSIDGLDYVLYSDTDICKSFEVKGTANALGCQLP